MGQPNKSLNLRPKRLSMASTLVPRCPLINPQIGARAARITSGTAFSLRATAARMESTCASTTTADSAAIAQGTEADTVVQYVVLRRDLIDTWPLGSVVTQGCHASVAAIWLHKDDPHTLDYCSDSNLDFMHKVSS